MQQELPKEVGGQGKIEDGALEIAGGLTTEKTYVGEKSFPLLSKLGDPGPFCL